MQEALGIDSSILCGVTKQNPRLTDFFFLFSFFFLAKQIKQSRIPFHEIPLEAKIQKKKQKKFTKVQTTLLKFWSLWILPEILEFRFTT